MRLDLAHGIQHHAHRDQHAGASEKLAHRIGNLHFIRENDRNDRNHREENRTGQGDPGHAEMEKVRCRLPRTHAGNVTTILF